MVVFSKKSTTKKLSFMKEFVCKVLNLSINRLLSDIRIRILASTVLSDFLFDFLCDWQLSIVHDRYLGIVRFRIKIVIEKSDVIKK